MLTKIQLQPAFVLHSRDYRNSSMLVEILSLNHGRLAMVARGAKTGKHRAAALLQPFRPVLLSWSGKSELKTLTAVEEDHSCHIKLSGSLLISAYYVNELMMRLLHQHEEHNRLFQIYKDTLVALSACQHTVASIEPVLRVFEKKLLEELGYGLILDADVLSGEPVQPGYDYAYILNQGPQRCNNDMPGGPRISGAALISLKNEQFSHTEELSACKRLMRAILRDLLGDKPLYSRSLYNKIVIS